VFIREQIRVFRVPASCVAHGIGVLAICFLTIRHDTIILCVLDGESCMQRTDA